MVKNIIAVLVLIGFVSGCSPIGSTIKPVKTNADAEVASKKVLINDMEKVAVFPLADYSKEQSFLKNPKWGINRKVMEEIADALNTRGITVSNQEDVNGLLVSEGIITFMKKSEDASNPQWELDNKPHSKIMKADMAFMISQDKTGEFNDNKILDGVTTGLSKGKIKELGEKLGVDKIIRGRIIEYGFTDTKSLSPANGFLPLLFGGLVEGMGAFAYQEAYETGLAKESWTVSEYVYDNEMGTGPGINIPSKQRACYFQVRLYLQDVKDGSILWSNRAEIKFTPQSSLAYDDNHPKNMTDRSINQGVTVLMEDLFKDRKKFLGIF